MPLYSRYSFSVSRVVLVKSLVFFLGFVANVSLDIITVYAANLQNLFFVYKDYIANIISRVVHYMFPLYG